MVETLEAGSQFYPVFFANQDCTGGQYPPQGETFDATHMSGQPFNLRALACLDASGQPADPLVANLPQGVPDTNQCPFNPRISAMLIPSGMSVTFYAPVNSKTSWIQQSVKDPGMINISSNQATNNFLIFPIDGQSNSKFRWGSSTGRSNCNYDTNVDQFFDVTGLMKYSSISCSAYFYPSLYSFVPPEGGQAMFCVSGNTSASGGAITRYAWHPDNLLDNSCVCADERVNVKRNDPAPLPPNGWTPGDLIATQHFFLWDDAHGMYHNFPWLCNTSYDVTPWQTCNHIAASNCYGDTNFAVNGTVQNVAFSYDNGTWSATQFNFCIGKPMVLANITIQRYGQSTPACDVIVPQFCQNSAFLLTNPLAAKACTCINEQKRIDLQFAGLDMPVQCFSDVCSNNDPSVYRTVSQSQGCSAKICSQIISINGTAISSQGQQTLTCNSVVYDLSSPDVSITPIPIVTVPDIPGPNLDVTFYLALGLMVCMVILLVVWGIRQAVISRRNKKLETTEITTALEQVLTK